MRLGRLEKLRSDLQVLGIEAKGQKPGMLGAELERTNMGGSTLGAGPSSA